MEGKNMEKQTKTGLMGLGLIGLGTGLAALGFLLTLPVCMTWSRTKLRHAYETGKKGMLSGLETAAEHLGEMTDKVQPQLAEAAKAAKHTTALAAGAIESAAHYVRERVS